MNLCQCGCGTPCQARYIQAHSPHYRLEDRAARFFAKFDTTDPNEHWIWTERLHPRDGYGRAWWGDRAVQSHVLAYELLVGPVPEGKQLDHLCRVRACGNPAHLEPVTCQTNLLRGETLAAANAAKTHCPQGHPYDEANTYITKHGGRDCRACSRNGQREARGYKGNPYGEGRCRRGHPLSGDNLYIVPSSGQRVCRTCKRLRRPQEGRSRR